MLVCLVARFCVFDCVMFDLVSALCYVFVVARVVLFHVFLCVLFVQ